MRGRAAPPHPRIYRVPPSLPPRGENSVIKIFSVHTKKRKGGVFKFLSFEERFKLLGFRDGLVWTVGLTEETKLGF